MKANINIQNDNLKKGNVRLKSNLNGQECIIQSRCTDEKGFVQPTPDEVATTWGVDPSAECFKVMGELCNHIPRDTHNSFIMSWKIAGDGSVTNPMRELYPKGRPDSLGHSHSGGHTFSIAVLGRYHPHTEYDLDLIDLLNNRTIQI